MKSLHIFVFTVLSITTTSVQSAELRETPAECSKRHGDPLTCLVSQARYNFAVCKLKVQIGEPSCAGPQGAEAVEPFYKQVISTYSKNPVVIARTKDFYASWRNAMRNLLPRTDQSVMSYKSSIIQSENAFDELGERLLLEK